MTASSRGIFDHRRKNVLAEERRKIERVLNGLAESGFGGEMTTEPDADVDSATASTAPLTKTADDAAAFLAGGGQLGDLVRRHDWSKTSIGPVDCWPQSLKTTVSLLLHSPVPIVLLWGTDGIMIYNDAYSAFAGQRHPRLLGSKVREGWPEVADFNDNVMRVGLAGKTLAYRDQELTLFRNGLAEQVWMNLDYSPVFDETGNPAGVIAIVVETTQRVLAERQNVAELDRLKQMFEQAPGFMALLEGPNHVFALANPTYMQLNGNREVTGKTLREAMPDIASQGFADILDNVFATGAAFVGSGIPVEVQPKADVPSAKLVVDFVMQPLTDRHGDVSGVFIQGTDVTQSARATSLREAQSRILELAVMDVPLPQLLEELVRTFEALSSNDMLGSILILDESGRHLRHAAAPNLPEPYCRAIDGIAIGAKVGSCGTAAYRGESVYVSDIASDPLWEDFRDLALEHGLRACWSTPIKSGNGRVLGTFAMYYRDVREAHSEDLEMVDFVTRTAALVIERKQTADALRRRGEEFSTLADNMPTLAWMAYADGNIFWYNRRWYEYTGSSEESQSGWGWQSVHDPDQLPVVVERWKSSLKTGTPFEMTFPLKGADGRFRPFLTRVVPVRDDAGRIVRWFGTNTDISAQVEIERELEEALQTKDILLHEVNHRVKNSLQVVTSLLMLQARQADDPGLKQSLMEARRRIGVVAGMHQRLYSTSQHDRVEFGAYLHELASETLSSLDEDARLELRSNIERNVVIALSQAVPLALVVSELITNAVKYAYPDGRKGHIAIDLTASGEAMTIRVADGGDGLPDDFAPDQSTGLGMKIISALLRQLRGTLTVENLNPGAAFVIAVPLRQADSRSTNDRGNGVAHFDHRG